MRRTLSSALALCTLMTLATPVFPGALYVPFFGQAAENATLELIVTNTGTEPQGFFTLFLEGDTDGTVRSDTLPNPTQVDPGATVIFDATPSVNGMIEVSADDSLVVSAQMVAGAEGAVKITQLPVISSDNLLPANSTIYLQGLERSDGGLLTDVSLFNVAHEASECRAKIFRAGGEAIGGTAVLPVEPLSVRVFGDAYDLVRVPEIADSKIEFSCDHDYYAFANVRTEDLGRLRIIEPAAAGASGVLRPGEGPDLAELSVPGLFFTPVQGNSVVNYNIPLEPGVFYDNLTIDFDLFLSRFQTQFFHAVVGLRHSDQDLFFAMFIRAGDRIRTFLDLGSEIVREQAGPWKAGGRYHLSFAYDAGDGTLRLQVFRGGDRVQDFKVNVAKVDLVDDGRQVQVYLGLRRIFDNGAFWPPYSWQYSNLEVVATPE